MSSKDHIEGHISTGEHLSQTWCPFLCGLWHVPGGEYVLSRTIDDGVESVHPWVRDGIVSLKCDTGFFLRQ